MSANFTPSLNSYTDLTPFRFWCQKILPLVYDDSLSYYELLCKVVDYLNKTMEDVNLSIEDVEKLHTAYDSLQKYVNDYFDNLDVQEEINNKLDALVEDGTIHDIFNPDVEAILNVANQAASDAIEAIPQNVTNWLNEHVKPETDILIDESLTIDGAAADAKATGDQIRALKSDLGNVTYSANANGKILPITVADGMTSGQSISVNPITSNDVSLVRLHGYNSANSDTIIGTLTVGDWNTFTVSQDFTNVRVVYSLGSTHIGDVYSAIAIVGDTEDISGYLAYTDNRVSTNEKSIANLNNMSDTPFSVAVPASLKGIVAFEFLDFDNGFKTFEIDKYRVRNFYYKASGFYMYLQLQRYVNDVWSNFDAITIVTADAPTETKLMVLESVYHRFRMAYMPSLLSAVSLVNVDYPIKNISRQPFVTYLQNQISATNNALQYGDYENQDTIKHVVHVNPNGNGDYTTIADAYAAITDSSFTNQYEVILDPGTYEEYNLICPPYTHTHGYDWKTTIVTSEGVTGSTLPVFDQRSFPSKLSNMTIITGTGYCIHNDYNFINTGAVYNENLYCKKVYGEPVQNFGWVSKANPTIIGAGAQYGGVKIVFNNCVFEDGSVTCHSNSAGSNEGNFHIVLKNCKVINAWVQLNIAGNSGAATKGLWVCEVDGLIAPIGCPALTTKVGSRLNNKTNFGWQIIGGGNKNFAVRLDNASDTLTTDVPWDNVNTNEKVYCQAVAPVTAGQWVTDALEVADAEESSHNIMGVALADANIGDTFPVWVGNAYMHTAANGEYGIGANGILSASATEKIGKIKDNILYRY